MPDNQAPTSPEATILVVADHDNSGDLLKDIFESYGYKVLSSPGLHEAAAEVLRVPVDLVVVELDRWVAGQTGALQALRRRSSSRILAVMADPALASMQQLVDTIVWKPFSVDELIASAAAFLQASETSKKFAFSSANDPESGDTF